MIPLWHQKALYLKLTRKGQHIVITVSLSNFGSFIQHKNNNYLPEILYRLLREEINYTTLPKVSGFREDEMS
jgi:hypothetical protein